MIVPTIVEGLVVYFDRSLGANLLYRFERPQFGDVKTQIRTGQNIVIGQEKEVSVVYGAEHLLRMIGAFAIFCEKWDVWC
jgi:mortality factor 4-like protein 1